MARYPGPLKANIGAGSVCESLKSDGRDGSP
jgi:hypothetical protein